MDISCPQCQTVYEIDEERLRHSRLTLECSACGHQFGVDPTAGVKDERQRRWMIERVEQGDILYCGGFEELHQWLMAQKVGPKDRLSRTGQKWTRLGDIGEFTPIFKAVDSIAEISANQADRPDRPRVSSQEGAAKRKEQRVRQSTDRQFQAAKPENKAKREAPEEAPKQRDNGRERAQQAPASKVNLEGGRFEDQEDVEAGLPTLGEQEQRVAGDDGSRGKKGGGRWMAVLLVMVVVAIAGWWALEVMQEEDMEEGDEVQATAGEAVAAGAEDVNTARAGATTAQMVAGVRAVVIEGRQAGLAAARDEAQEASEEEEARPQEQSVAQILAGAQRSRDRGDIAQAFQRYEAVLERRPGQPDAMIGVGWTHLRDGDPGAAIQAFEAAYRRHPDRGEALIGKARAHRDRSDYAAALDQYEAYLEAHPGGDQRSIAEFQSREMADRLESEGSQ